MSIDQHGSGAARRLATTTTTSAASPTLRVPRHSAARHASADNVDRRRYAAAGAAAAAPSSSSLLARWRSRLWWWLQWRRLRRRLLAVPRRLLRALRLLCHVAGYLLARVHLRRDPTAALTTHLYSAHMRRIVPLDGAVAARYGDNTVINSRYTALNFLVYNLYEQFRRPINLYFLLVALLQFISVIAPVNPLTTLLPLTFAFLLTAAKEGYDDVKRHRQDATYNHVPRAVLDAAAGRWVYKRNCELRVGDVVMLRQNEEVPCDVVLLAATSRAVFIRTDNLDGEMDLKPRVVVQPPRRALVQRLRAQRRRQRARAAPHAPLPSPPAAAAADSVAVAASTYSNTTANNDDSISNRHDHGYNSSVVSNSANRRHLVEVLTAGGSSNDSSAVDSARRSHGRRHHYPPPPPPHHHHDSSHSARDEYSSSVAVVGGEHNDDDNNGDDDSDAAAMLLSIHDDAPTMLSKLRRVRLHCPPPNASLDSFNGRAEFALEQDEHLREYHGSDSQQQQQQQQQHPLVIHHHHHNNSSTSTSMTTMAATAAAASVSYDTATSPLSLRVLADDATTAAAIANSDGGTMLSPSWSSSAHTNAAATSMSTVEVSMSHLNLLPQSSFLKNVERALVVAVYTGDDTKFGMNKRPPPVKWAKIDRLVNVYAMLLFVCQLLCALICGLAGFLVNRHVHTTHWYLPPPSFETARSVFVIYPLRFFLLTTAMIPVSFKFIVDMSKYYMAMLVEWDSAMTHGDKTGGGGGCKVKNSNILEDLGQIDYVLSDKTGTMTKNVMRLRYVAVQATRQQVCLDALTMPDNVVASPTAGGGGACAHAAASASPRAFDDVHGATTAAAAAEQKVGDGGDAAASTLSTTTTALRRVCVALALCNTVEVVATRDGVDYQATSPDETALCCGVAKLGVQLLARRTVHHGGGGDNKDNASTASSSHSHSHSKSSDSVGSSGHSGGGDTTTVVLGIDGVSHEWRVHHVFLFSSEHKSMSVLVEDTATRRLWLFVKGADERVRDMTRSRAALDDDNNDSDGDDHDAHARRAHSGGGGGARTRVRRATAATTNTTTSTPAPPLDDFVAAQLTHYANRGLRTLLVAARELTRDEFAAVRRALQRAELLTDRRQAALDAVRARLERGVTVLGVTAIEDALQDDVQATIRDLLAAGIRVWMITGDKLATAEKIALSCALYAPDDHVLRITDEDDDDNNNNDAATAAAAQMLGQDEAWVQRLLAAEVPRPPSSLQSTTSTRALRRGRGRRRRRPATDGVAPHDEDTHYHHTSNNNDNNNNSGNNDNNDDDVDDNSEDDDHSDDHKDSSAVLRRREAHRVVQRVLNYAEMNTLHGKHDDDDDVVTRRQQQPSSDSGDHVDVEVVVVDDGASNAATRPPPSPQRRPPPSSSSSTPRTVLLVQGGPVLQRILSTERLRSKFAALSRHCASVVCARTTPSQKAAIADFVRQQGYMTLAVGDGGNDVAMLQEANIGVGIAGREGRQASRAADFAITQFCDLRPLIFVHGQQAYVRTAFVIRYSFYKSMLIAFVQLVYNAAATRLSGASFWNSFALMMWNGAYTLPQTFLYCLDRPAPRVVLERNPVLYKLTRHNRDMQAGEFFGHHLLLAVLQSTALLLLTVSLTDSDTAAAANGWASTHDGNFTIAYTALIASQALVVWLQSHSLTWPNVLCLLAMPPLYLVTTLAFSSVPGVAYYGVLVSALLRVDAVLAVVAICACLVMLFLLFAVCHHGVRPNARMLLSAAERTRQRRLLRHRAYRNTQPLLVRWFGFLPEAASSYLVARHTTGTAATTTSAAASATTARGNGVVAY